MVIPHFIVLWALAIAADVVVIIGWFGALFAGRLPAFAADYLAGFVRWQTRVFGYAILITDVYPPFTLDARASADAGSLASSASHVASIFASLGAATSVTQYQNIANSSGVQQAVSQVSQDYTTLANQLTNS